MNTDDIERVLLCNTCYVFFSQSYKELINV